MKGLRYSPLHVTEFCGPQNSEMQGKFKVGLAQLIIRKFNYTILFMKYYIYTSKMRSQGIYLSIFVNKVLFKYRLESFSL